MKDHFFKLAFLSSQLLIDSFGLCSSAPLKINLSTANKYLIQIIYLCQLIKIYKLYNDNSVVVNNSRDSLLSSSLLSRLPEPFNCSVGFKNLRHVFLKPLKF